MEEGATRAPGLVTDSSRARCAKDIEREYRRGRERELPCGEEGGAVAINFSSRD